MKCEAVQPQTYMHRKHIRLVKSEEAKRKYEGKIYIEIITLKFSIFMQRQNIVR